MLNNIPFDIQLEIIKRLPVKSLMRFRSVCKTWNSLIDSSQFIADHYGQQTPLHHLFVRYRYADDYIKDKLVSYADDATFPLQKVSVSLPLQLRHYSIIGCSHGLLCLHGGYRPRDIAYLWNISIRKGVVVPLPNVEDGMYKYVLGFGVCGTDPKIVKITQIASYKPIESATVIPWQVEVFTISTRAWRIPYKNLPRKYVYFDFADHANVVTDEFLYWIAVDRATTDNLIISFDMMSEEFREVNLPSILTHGNRHRLSLFKQSESVVVLQSSGDADDLTFVVWMMEDGATSLFRKLYTFNSSTPHSSIYGFRMNGGPIVRVMDADHLRLLVVYEPYTKHIDSLKIDEKHRAAKVYSYYYKETLLLHDQPNMICNHN